MKLEIGRRSLRIEADEIRWTAFEEAYIEDVLGLKKEGDAIAIARKTECKYIRPTFFLETAPLEEHVTEEKVCRWRCSGTAWMAGCSGSSEGYPLIFLSPIHERVNFCPNCGGRIVTGEDNDANE